MLMSKSLRWSGHAIGNTRRRPLILASIFRQRSTLFRAHGLRYASTSPTPAPPSLHAPKAALDVPPELAKDDFFVDMTNVPVQIGYLKELGLDYGWGPTAIMQSIIEYIHVFGDTPWWLSITLAIVGVRLGVVKLYIGAADTSAKLAAIKPITDPITQLMKKAQLAGDQRGVMENRQKLSMIHSRADIKLWKAFLPLVQVFIGFGTFRLLRGMSSLPVPGLDTGGILWFHDLTMKDPFYALPISTAVLTLIVMKTSKGTNSLLPAGVLKAMTYGLPAVSLLFMSGWPAALQLSFFISTLFSTFQSSMIQWSPFRRLVKIAPLPANVQTTPVAEAAYNGRLNLGETAKRTLSVSGSSRTTKVVSSSQTGGVLGMLERAKDNFQTMQKDVTKTVENYTGSSAAKDDKKIAEAYEKRRAAEDAKKLREDALARRARARARKRSQV